MVTKAKAPVMPRGAKVEAVKAYLQAHPQARNKDIQEALIGKVGQVNATTIGQAKQSLGLTSAPAAASSPANGTKAGRRKRSVEITASGMDLMKARHFIKDLGGSVDDAISLLEQYRRFYADE